MTTIKSFTSLEQSKKLAEILSIESADGFWEYHNKWYSEGDEWEGYEDYPRAEPYLEYTRKENEWKEDKSDIPCWSLASLLGVLPKNLKIGRPSLESNYRGCYWIQYYDEFMKPNDYKTECFDNPVDACVDMIEKLNELKML